MGIEVSWENEAKTIIQYVYDGRWTLRDFDDARIHAAKLEETVSHRVDVIVDVITAGPITAVQNIGRWMRAVERDRHRWGRGWVEIQPHNLQRRTRTEGCAAEDRFDERSSVASEFD